MPSSTWPRDLRALLGKLPLKRKHQIAWIAVVMLLAAMGEVASISLILPFLATLGSTESLLNQPRLAHIIQTLHISSHAQILGWLTLLFVAAILSANALQVFALRSQHRLAARIGNDLGAEIFQKILSQPYPFHAATSSAELISRITHDVGTVSNLAIPQAMALLTHGLAAIAIIVTLLVINPVVALGVAAVLGLAYKGLLQFNQAALTRNSHVIHSHHRLALKALQEGLGGIRDVLLDGTQKVFADQFREADRPFREAQASNQLIAQIPRYIIESLAFVCIGILAWHLALQDQGFTHAVPVLGALALGANRLLPALQRCFGAITILRGTHASLIQVCNAIDLPCRAEADASAGEVLKLQKSIEIEGVSYRYAEGPAWALQNLSITIPAYHTVGFVGSSGSGKSTLADLILGLLEPQVGHIRVDGTPLSGSRIEAWRRGIAHVPQTIFLSDATIAENIAFGTPSPDIDMLRVRDSARMAMIESFIESNPAGFNTLVGERGVRLSGGQRQRIGIARALYKQASLIVFDEATSALDTVTERELMEAIDSLRSHLTIVLIAHRISTVERCDRIFEFSEGRLVASGTYAELMNTSPSFRRLAGKDGEPAP